MQEKIADFLRSRKGQDLALVVSILLVGTVAFGLGRLSNVTPPRMPVTLYLPATSTVLAHVVAPTVGEVVPVSPPEDSGTMVATKQYVGSKNGTVYHLPWCSGAVRMKEENKVWFTTKEEAERAGYRPASNCKGI